MHKILSIILACTSMAVFAGSLIVKDNADVALTLSQGNYNRIVVKMNYLIVLSEIGTTADFKEQEKECQQIYF